MNARTKPKAQDRALAAAQNEAMTKQLDGVRLEVKSLKTPPVAFVGADGKIKLRHSDGTVSDAGA